MTLAKSNSASWRSKWRKATTSRSLDRKPCGGTVISLDGQLKTIAQSLEVGAPKGPSKKDKQLIASSGKRQSGTQFDEEYLKAIDRAHKQDIKDIEIEINNTL